MVVSVFSSKVFLIEVCILFFRHNAIVPSIDYSRHITFICTQKREKFVCLTSLRGVLYRRGLGPNLQDLQGVSVVAKMSIALTANQVLY